MFATVMLPLLGAALAFSAKLFAHVSWRPLDRVCGCMHRLALPLLVIARLFPIIWAGKTISEG